MGSVRAYVYTYRYTYRYARRIVRGDSLANQRAFVFEDDWQPMRSRRCANERCACVNSNPSFVGFRERHDRVSRLDIDLGDTLDIIERLNH